MTMQEQSIPLVQAVHQALETGKLSLRLERQIQSLLHKQEFDTQEIAAIDQLLWALYDGRVQTVA